MVDSTDESVHEGSLGGLMGVERFLAFISQSSLDLLPTACVELVILVTSKYPSTWLIKASSRPGAGTGLNEINSRCGRYHCSRIVATSSDSLPQRDKCLATMSLATTAKLYPLVNAVAAIEAKQDSTCDASEAITKQVYKSRVAARGRKTSQS